MDYDNGPPTDSVDQMSYSVIAPNTFSFSVTTILTVPLTDLYVQPSQAPNVVRSVGGLCTGPDFAVSDVHGVNLDTYQNHRRLPSY